MGPTHQAVVPDHPTFPPYAKGKPQDDLLWTPRHTTEERGRGGRWREGGRGGRWREGGRGGRWREGGMDGERGRGRMLEEGRNCGKRREGGKGREGEKEELRKAFLHVLAYIPT